MKIEDRTLQIEDRPSELPVGQAYWRSLEEYADSSAFRASLASEFPGYDPEELVTMSRRKFLALAGASMALAGLTLTGCRRWPKENVVPYSARPEGMVPGEPEYYASIIERGGVANPVLVRTFDGRPIKIEGNRDGGGSGVRPYLRGKTNVFDQAETLTLYDPDRARVVKHHDEPTTWQQFRSFVKGHPAFQQTGADTGLAVLAEPTSSPTVKRLREQFKKKFPAATWYTYAPISRDNEITGAKLAFGKPLRPVYDLTKADIIVTLDCDLFEGRPDSPRLAYDWAQGRRGVDDHHHPKMNRLYAVEPGFTPTGSVADHRLVLKASKIGSVVEALNSGSAAALNGASTFVEALIDDLNKHHGKAIVIAGESQPAQVHAACFAINQKLGAVESGIVKFIDEPLAEDKAASGSIKDLTDRMAAGEIDTLVILGGNPAYDAPADVKFAEALAKVAHTVRLGMYEDETGALCEWSLPMAHALEAWGDGRQWDGTISVQQPTIQPIFEDAQRTTGGRSAIEVLAILLGEQYQDGLSLVRQTFTELAGGKLDEKLWRRVLHDGQLVGTDLDAVEVGKAEPVTIAAQPIEGFEVTISADPTLYDGRYANNGWLQEAPKPLTKVTWDNVTTISIADAKALGVKNGDHLAITINGVTLDIPAYLMPGQAKGSIGLTLGFGRSRSGHVGTAVGVNTYAVRFADTPHIAAAKVAKGKGSTDLATTTIHHLIDPDWVHDKHEGQDTPATYALTQRAGKKGASGKLLYEATLDEFKKKGHHAFGAHHADLSLQLFQGPAESPNPRNPDGPQAFNDPHAWGMAIDMNSCTGCNACVVACQAENNVPVTGKSMVLMSREMHWLRIDTYFKGSPEVDEAGIGPDVVHQPVMCVHCENAPCEQVCPVAATVHDSEGLNTMVYNRCIGTRYCSNNCPYKVRRFNYYDFHAKDVRGGKSAKPWLNIPDTQQQGAISEITRMVFNPDVTVRMRGVMEKCTYCTQRIAAAKIRAKAEWAKTQQGIAGYDRDTPHVKDGEIVTACQEACATDAIVFGDLNDPNSKVSTIHRDNHRAYSLLEELNTRPRTKHLAKIRNPKGKG